MQTREHCLPVGLKLPKDDCRGENFVFVLWFVLLYIWQESLTEMSVDCSVVLC